jgi:hypothetical protein
MSKTKEGLSSKVDFGNLFDLYGAFWLGAALRTPYEA